MGTRSDIIVHLTDGKWARIYCHWDGYLDHNGRILFEHYTSQRQADELVRHGNLSQLQPRCTKPAGHTFDKPVKGFCVYYGRDRAVGMWCQEVAKTKAELLAHEAAIIGDTLAAVWPEADTWTEFTYVWDEGKWWAGDPDEGSQTLVDLGDLLLGKRTLKPLVKMFGGIVLGRHSGQV